MADKLSDITKRIHPLLSRNT